LHIELDALEDPEAEINDLFVEKYSSLIPFREHPINKEIECIKNVSRGLRIKGSDKIINSLHEKNFSPQCSVFSIICGNDFEIDRRFQKKKPPI